MTKKELKMGDVVDAFIGDEDSKIMVFVDYIPCLKSPYLCTTIDQWKKDNRNIQPTFFDRVSLNPLGYEAHKKPSMSWLGKWVVEKSTGRLFILDQLTKDRGEFKFMLATLGESNYNNVTCKELYDKFTWPGGSPIGEINNSIYVAKKLEWLKNISVQDLGEKLNGNK